MNNKLIGLFNLKPILGTGLNNGQNFQLNSPTFSKDVCYKCNAGPGGFLLYFLITNGTNFTTPLGAAPNMNVNLFYSEIKS